jgi:hypothetical protein
MLGFGALGEYALGEGPKTATAATAPKQAYISPPTLRPRSSVPQSVGLNLALIASLTPFVQRDWAPPKRAPRPVLSLSRSQSLPLVANLGPFRQQDFTKPASPRRSPPQLASLNLNLIANLGPFRTNFVAGTKPVAAVSFIAPNIPLLVQQSTPFANFVYPAAVKAKFALPAYSYNVALYTPILDTHDGVWVKKKRKKLDRDPLDLELEEKAKRRAAIELAVYGDPKTYELPPEVKFYGTPAPPPNVEDLTKAIMAAKQMQEQQRLAELEQDDEDVLEMILREI